MTDSPVQPDLVPVCPCEVSVRDCLDTLAELNKVENANESTARDICHLQLLGARLHWWAVRWDTLGANRTASVAPDAQIQCSLGIISDLVNYLTPSYEDKYDETGAIMERQEMALSAEAVQERFTRLRHQIRELEGFLPSDSALKGAVIFNHALSASFEKLIALSRQEGIDDFTMSLARLKVASLCHVSEVVDYWGEASGKLDANPEYLRDNESRRSYFANYNKGLVLGMRHLIDKLGLDKQPRANTPVYIEDMVPFNETILQTREKRFHLGFQRIVLCLYNSIGLFTVNRKQAILHLQFKHLQISLQRDPHGGPPVPMIEIEPQFVKSVLGMYKVYVRLSDMLSPNLQYLRTTRDYLRDITCFQPTTSVEKDPELQSAIRWQVELEDRCAQSNDPTLRALLEQQERSVHNTRRRLQERRRKEIRQVFSRKQAVIDIERQLTGGAVNDEPAREVLRQDFAMPPEHILLVESFFTWPTSNSLEDEWARRNKAVMAGVQYCGFQEGGPLRGRPKRPASEDEELIADPAAKKQKGPKRPTVSASEKKLDTIKEKVVAVKPSACFQC
ncbi:hypothetical protein KXV52_001756 [Aspergillus fumigatus]|nr:hypothetical protein KXW84_004838 [Aspergillus fumigatus]KAH3370453.1 hypothetical protein KXV52_001756 [Aspergillus fumigatus]